MLSNKARLHLARDRAVEAKVDQEHSQVFRDGHATLVRPFPISIDFSQHEHRAASSGGSGRKESLARLVDAAEPWAGHWN